MEAKQKEEFILHFPSADRCPAASWEPGPQYK